MTSSVSSPSLARAFTDRAATPRPARGVWAGLSPEEAANADAKRRRIAEAPPVRLTPQGKPIVPRGSKHPIQPDEALRTYRIRLHPTAAQASRLRGQWFRAARGAYNHFLAAVRDGAHPCSPEAVNRMCAPQPPPSPSPEVNRCLPAWILRDAPRCIYKNAMLDLVASHKGNLTKQRKDPRHRWRNKFRSLRWDPTECIRLDAARFAPEDRTGRGTPKDKGPVLEITTAARGSGSGDGEGQGPQGPRGNAWAHLHLGGAMRELGPITMKDRPWLLDRLVAERWLRHEGKLLWDKRRQALYLLAAVRRRRPADDDPEHHRKRVVAMDPGTRAFQTFYDPADGTNGILLDRYDRWDANDQRRRTPEDRRSVMDELRRRQTRIRCAETRVHHRPSSVWRTLERQPRGRRARAFRWACEERARRAGSDGPEAAEEWARWKRWRHRRRHQARRQADRHLKRDRARLMGFQGHMHYAAINHLWSRWDVVIVSTAQFGRMMQRPNRPFGARVARDAVAWCHYGFRQRLISSAFVRAGKYVIPTDEAYTTRTCGRCGHVRPPLNGEPRFVCLNPACGVQLHRDVNAASHAVAISRGRRQRRGPRNIALRVLTRNLVGEGAGREAAASRSVAE